MTVVEVADYEDGEVGADFCLTCGKSLLYSGRGRRPKYCPEHKPARAKSAGRGGGTLKPNAGIGVVSKLLIIVTALSAHRQCTRNGIRDNDQLEDELTMTDDEADAIASPISRWAVKSKTGEKILKPIVENEDLIDAGVALWEYHRRTSTIVKEIRRLQNVTNQPSSTPVSGAAARLANTNGNGAPFVGQSLL
jgi:hypothetical protein